MSDSDDSNGGRFKPRRYILSAVLLLILGISKLYFGAVFAYVYETYDSTDDTEIKKSIENCKELMTGFLHLPESDDPNNSNHHKCEKLHTQWFQFELDFMFLHRIDWFLGTILGILLLFIFYRLLREPSRAQRSMGIAFALQVAHSLVVILLAIVSIFGSLEIYYGLWPVIMQSNMALLMINGSFIMNIFGTLVFCLVYGLIWFKLKKRLLPVSEMANPSEQGGSG